ncbi:MAG: hypothetical protein ACR2MS_07195 [Weeksellaceae bacterium]
MKKDIEDLKKELVVEIKALAADIASSNSYVGLLANEIKFRSLQEKFINLKFLERKQYGLEIFESEQSYEDPIFNQDTVDDISPIEDTEIEMDLKLSTDKGEMPEIVEELSTQNKPSGLEEKESTEEIEQQIQEPPMIDNPQEEELARQTKSLSPLQLDFNDQLAFQYQLFDGDKESMDMVIRTLNAIHSLADSKKYLFDLQQEMQWEDKEEYVERLEELVIKRFD